MLKRFRIGDLGDIYTGNTPSKKNMEFYDSEDIMFIKPDMLEFNIAKIEKANEYISEKAREKARIIPKGSLLVSCIGNIGKLGINNEEVAFNQQINAIVHNDKIISSKYLAYVIKYNQKKLESIANTAVVPIINKNQFSEFELLIHKDLEIQNKIVDILDKAQQLIDKRKEQIEALDELVKSQFIEMFGDLSKNDKGWVEVELSEACDVIHRYPTFYGMEYIEKGTPVIRIGNIKMDGILDDNMENYIFVYDNVNNDFPLTSVELGDILMAVRGDGSAAKRIGIVKTPKLIGANISPNLLRIKAKDSVVNNIYLFRYLISEVGQRRLDAYVNKTAKKNIAAKDIKKVITPIPPIELQNKFADFVKQVDKLKFEMEKSLKELEDNFNSLMQKAFKGELFN